MILSISAVFSDDNPNLAMALVAPPDGRGGIWEMLLFHTLA